MCVDLCVGILEEAEFYNLPSLVKITKERLIRGGTQVFVVHVWYILSSLLIMVSSTRLTLKRNKCTGSSTVRKGR